MADKKDKAFEGAEEVKDNAIKEEAIASAELAEGGAGESKPAKKVEKAEKKPATKNAIKVGDFVVYKGLHCNRCVQVLEADDVSVTVVGDEGTRIKLSLDQVKKA